MSIEVLLEPVDQTNPCGEDLEYHSDFLEMEQASQGKIEQQFGSTIIPAEQADWPQVERLAKSLLTRTKDLRIMFRLAEAWTQLYGLRGYADGLDLILRALDQYWEDLYPKLEYDGDPDPLFRISVFASLGDRSDLSTMFRSAPLLNDSVGELSVRDAVSLLDGSKAECETFPGGKSRLIHELSISDQACCLLLPQISERLARIKQIVTDHLGEDALPDMAQLNKTITVISQACSMQSSQNDETEVEQVDGQQDNKVDSPLLSDGSNKRTFSHTDQIRTREDALLALDKIKDYFIVHEPSHPAPLMIERVRRLITMDFIKIIEDLAPDSVNHMLNVFGVKTDSNDQGQ